MGMRTLRGGKLSAVALAFVLCACAGRDPHPVAVVQPQDAQSDCAMIRAEIEASNIQAEKLAEENHAKIAQNVAAGSSASSSGRSGSRWMRKARSERKWMRSNPVSSISPRWLSSAARNRPLLRRLLARRRVTRA